MTHIWQSPDWPQFAYDNIAVEPLLLEITGHLGEVRGLHAGLSDAQRERIRLRELAFELEHSPGAKVSVAQMMHEARDPTVPLNADRLRRWHRLLFKTANRAEADQWREAEVVVAAGPEEIRYTAVPPERVAQEMAMFFRWLGQGGLPAPVKAALADLWFQSIQPYSNGTQSMGRAVMEHIFARSNPLPFSLSRQIGADRQAYFAALQSGREQGEDCIDASAFVEWFLRALLQGVRGALEEARFLTRGNQFFLARGGALSARQTRALHWLFTQGAQRVAKGISTGEYGKIAGVSAATATRDLAALAGQGALERSDEGGRSTRYYPRFV